MLLAGHISVNDDNTYQELNNMAPLNSTKEHWRASILQYWGPDPERTQTQSKKASQHLSLSFEVVWSDHTYDPMTFYSGPDPEHQQTFDCMLLCDCVYVMQLSPPPH